MKLQQLHEDISTLEEGILQRTVAAAALVLGTLYPAPGETPRLPPGIELGSQTGADPDQLAADIVDLISNRYKVSPQTVEQIVHAAKKYEHPDFPKAKDILAVVGVESSFNPQAVSKLKRDPARGVMQIRPGVWKLPKGALNTIDGQVKHGAEILRAYYQQLGSKEAALHAYNVGLTNHHRSAKKPEKGNPRYVPKVQAELNHLTPTERRPAGTGGLR